MRLMRLRRGERPSECWTWGSQSDAPTNRGHEVGSLGGKSAVGEGKGRGREFSERNKTVENGGTERRFDVGGGRWGLIDEGGG